MKKFLSILLVLSMALSLTACSNKDNIQNNNSETVTKTESNISNKDISSNNSLLERVKNAPETSADDFTTEEVDGGISLKKYNGNDEIVVIPDEIDGMPVVAIGGTCFTNNKEIKAVKVSDNVINIQTNAFVNCFNLEIFISGASVELIGDYTLSYCKLLKYVELNDGIKSLGRLCFGATDSLMELYIPASVTELDFPFLETQTNVTITCEAGSAAETYAKENGINYQIK